MRVAVIDLGTNTFNLLIVEISKSNQFTKIYSDRIPVKLGEGGINKGYIAEPAYKRGIEALISYRGILNTYEITNITAFATSAIRSANNGKEFIKEAFEKTQIEITSISGDKEAELIYYANRLAVRLDENPVLIMDIGGGSTEFIIANNEKIFWKQSFLLGVSRLKEKFNPENPIELKTITNFYNYVLQELQPLVIEMKKYRITRLIGSSGAFDSFVDMIAERYGTEKHHTGKTEYEIDLNHYFEIGQETIHSTTEQRLKLKGLIEMRVDMIVLSYLFVDLVLQEFNIRQMTASIYSLKEGVIVEMLMGKNN